MAGWATFTTRTTCTASSRASTSATSRATSALVASTRRQRAPQRVKPEWPSARLACNSTWPAWPRLCQTARSRPCRPCAHAEQTVHFRCAGDNGCNYGACFNPLAVDSYHTRCVHDASFCSTVEQYYTAAQVVHPLADICTLGAYTFTILTPLLTPGSE